MFERGKNMKRIHNSKFKAIIAAMLALAIVVALAGCSPKTEPEQPEQPDPLSDLVNTVSDYNADASGLQLSIDASNQVHDISDLLFGIFFEDINFSADGGLYAEKVANRSFEFTELADGDQLYHWNVVNDAKAEVKVNDVANALNENNTNYLVLTNGKSELAGIENIGFMEGMNVVQDAQYDFSVYAKALDGYTGAVTVRLVVTTQEPAEEGQEAPAPVETVAAEGKIDKITDKWAKYSL